MCTKARLRDVVSRICYHCFEGSPRKQAGHVCVAHHQVGKDVVVRVQHHFSVLQLQVSRLWVDSRLGNDFPRKSSLTPWISWVLAETFAAVVAVVSVHDLVDCRVKMSLPLSDGVALPAATAL